jgi:glycerol-3-phosphate dehydrogenase
MLVFNAADGRSIFAIRRGEVVYVGTTDTSYAGGPDLWPAIDLSDVEYLLEPLPRYLAIEPVKAEECLSAWAGLRPLVAQPGKPPTEISRRDEVLVGPAGVIAIAGGKLTGYRPVARRVVEQVAELLGRPLARVAPEDQEPPLPGGDFDGELAPLAASLVRSSGVSDATAQRLAQLYGAEATRVVALGSQPLAPGAPVLRGEVDWAVGEEAAATVEDVLYRRMRVALYEPAASDAIVGPIARRAAELLGWDAQRAAEEERQTRARLAADRSFAGPAR